MSAHAEALHGGDHHGPPAANQSSRIAPTILGMFLFIGLTVIGMSALAGWWLRQVALEEGE